MPKVLFDHQKFSTQRYGGISRYFATLIEALENTNGFSTQTGVLYSDNQYLKSKLPVSNLPFSQSLFKTSLAKRYTYQINERYSSGLIRKQDFDLFHPTYYDPYFLPILKKPFVTTLHDMTYERLPEYFWSQDPLPEQKRKSAERADAIIAISETTKRDLIRYCPDVDPTKIRVIYHGIDTHTPAKKDPVTGLPENYILFVGDRGGYKNFYLFMDACTEILKTNTELSVVLTGGGALGVAEREYIYRNRIQNRVFHFNATDTELNTIFAHALVFVYPSLHEGFGLPILEAFKMQCPVLLSDTECFREIAGNAVDYFQSHSKEDLLYQLRTLISDSVRRQQLVTSGNRRLLDFPMEECIRQTLDLYRSLS